MTKLVEQLKIKGQNILSSCIGGRGCSLVADPDGSWLEAPLCPHSELPAAVAWYEPVRHHHKVHLHGQEGDQQAAETEGEEERVDESAERKLGDGLSHGCCLNRMKPTDLHGFSATEEDDACFEISTTIWQFILSTFFFKWAFQHWQLSLFFRLQAPYTATFYILPPLKEINLTFVLVFKMSVFLFLLRNDDYWVLFALLQNWFLTGLWFQLFFFFNLWFWVLETGFGAELVRIEPV